MTTLAELRQAALAAFRPPQRLPLSAWIERCLVLPEGTSAQPGKVRLWPYQREIADAISDPECERVTLVKAVRVGFTTVLTGAIGGFVANEPCPVLVLMPTEGQPGLCGLGHRADLSGDAGAQGRAVGRY